MVASGVDELVGAAVGEEGSVPGALSVSAGVVLTAGPPHPAQTAIATMRSTKPLVDLMANPAYA